MARVLVIDDEASIRKLLRSILELDGHEVEEADDGSSGIKKYRQNPSDLVITDLIMPEKEGIETIVELKREFPRLKVIAVSGGGVVGPSTYLKMAQKVGADRVFEKPFGFDEMRDAVAELL